MIDLRATLQHPNVAAMLRVVRQRESSQTDVAYRMRYHPSKVVLFDSFAQHPHIFERTPGGQLSSAAGAYQITWTTWIGLVKQYGFTDFTPATQDLACVALLAGRKALDPLYAGDLDAAIALCRPEWTSLPGAAENTRYTLAQAREVYEQYGGRIGPPAPVEERDLSNIPPIKEKATDPLTAISIFGPMISSLIPQIGKLFGSGSDMSNRNVAAATLALDTVVKATGAVNEQDAINKMQADPAVLQAATHAVLTEPDIMRLLEVGGGVVAARAADVVVMASDKPFWKASAVFWVSLALLPMIYWYVGSSVAGGIDIPTSWPWYAQLPLKLLGVAWDSGARVGLANLIVGLVLGGICGVYYGISVTQQKQQSGAVEAAKA